MEKICVKSTYRYHILIFNNVTGMFEFLLFLLKILQKAQNLIRPIFCDFWLLTWTSDPDKKRPINNADVEYSSANIAPRLAGGGKRRSSGNSAHASAKRIKTPTEARRLSIEELRKGRHSYFLFGTFDKIIPIALQFCGVRAGGTDFLKPEPKNR